MEITTPNTTPNGGITTETILSTDDNFITRTLIDTEAFASFFKTVSQKNEKIISDFTGITANTPISDRISVEIDVPGPGFDAGVAATLALIPSDHVAKVMELHNGIYTPELIAEMRKQIEVITSNTSANGSSTYDQLYTFWWLAMSSVCADGNTTSVDFYEQYQQAVTIYRSFDARWRAANMMLKDMDDAFVVSDNSNNVPHGTTDGSLHAAYLAGYEVASLYAANYGIYFLGTYVPGKFDNIISNHTFSTETDTHGRTKSGVINSTFLKFGTYEEMNAATALL